MFKLTVLTAALIVTSTVAFAENRDVFRSNHDIYVEPNESPRDVTCLRCTIYVRGEVNGDVTAIDGNVVLENAAQVHGDTTSIFGDVRLAAETTASRDVTAVAGTVHRDPRAVVNGDVTSLEGGAWTLLIVVVPLAILGGFIALIAWIIFWMVRRNEQRLPLRCLGARHYAIVNGANSLAGLEELVL